ncbi:hypothetical protein CP97_14689 [Aurantiacibacter atlanticus]|uniref:Uncharacterized protein n=1 Tax=Aurantiacibacter atlanticus TaxID=1648404 RepID=A0A168M0X3_9SPHN|nr:hypothetical protein CP97_14689 [Aurantiacibacter atlanticus]
MKGADGKMKCQLMDHSKMDHGKKPDKQPAKPEVGHKHD